MIHMIHVYYMVTREGEEKTNLSQPSTYAALTYVWLYWLVIYHTCEKKTVKEKKSVYHKEMK